MIESFQKEYRWLSNFAPVEIIYKDVLYLSVEHAYMSAKSNSLEWKVFCKTTSSPGIVKNASKNIKLIDGWNDIKISVMRECLDIKFSKEPYRTLLLETESLYISEGNDWGDTFWGVDLKTGIGFNILGKLIMLKRSKLQFEESIQCSQII